MKKKAKAKRLKVKIKKPSFEPMLHVPYVSGHMICDYLNGELHWGYFKDCLYFEGVYNIKELKIRATPFQVDVIIELNKKADGHRHIGVMCCCGPAFTLDGEKGSKDWYNKFQQFVTENALKFHQQHT